jgi:hypothetical protein
MLSPQSLRDMRQWSQQAMPIVRSAREQVTKELSSTPMKTARRRALEYLEKGVPRTPVKAQGRRKRTNRKKRTTRRQ